jgi:hypothetical protein
MLVDGLRLLWLPGIAQVGGTPVSRITEWIGRGDYYFDSPVGPTSATFILMNGANLLDTFAAEMSRFSSAAIETSIGIGRSQMPKSTAWLFIQTYYAAFYAAHSILRSAGISASNFRANQCQRADVVAAALGFNNAPLNATQFRCAYSPATTRLVCVRASGSGVHEQFWRIFDDFITNADSQILSSQSLTAQDAQDISATLSDLRSILRNGSHHGGNWLSTIRNNVTYGQQHETWFPYGRSQYDCDRLFAIQKEWRKAPEQINLRLPKAKDSELFIITCAFLVSLSVAVTKDMELRCSSGESFLRRGPLRLLHQASARVQGSKAAQPHKNKVPSLF